MSAPRLNIPFADKPVNDLNDQELKELVIKTKNMRDKMGGTMYWNMLNDDYRKLIAYCRIRGVKA